ncbi:anti-ECFsigma factor, ChrR [Spongiibacter sp. IMCC21906]|uniref:ChrR family anti-sigma-E factor n=1 Tax=Spongiibacter sp. IMCC21906 TaxID=1620392 RepID=UPI00062DD869|nr:ChrR family anti-sigma-E factor [Spongiibacter sp. IMCC21906]AKH69149.1 anti-ECFsigma factor, ChrR [Spongiibacter sp. IMCC21906]
MSRIEHHPSEDTLASYSAGALPAALALVVGCHLEFCSSCRRDLAGLEHLGGELMTALPPKALSTAARDRMLDLLDEQVDMEVSTVTSTEKAKASSMPALLSKLTGSANLESMPWKVAAPGIRQIVLKTGEGNARLLRISAGMRMPVHSHRGNELTMILQGGYSDALGQFNAGDVADLDGSVEHQPIADDDQDCICLAGMDAPLIFKGWIAKLMQPFVGM